MLYEIIDIVKSVLARKPKIEIPSTLLYDHNLDEYVMTDQKRSIIDFALAAGVWPAVMHNGMTEDGLWFAVWTGHGAKTLKKRVGK